MIVNVGGFGHTGNTALLDFLIDTGHFAPLARDFGESSIMRGKWCLNGMFKSLKQGQCDVPVSCYTDAFLGVIRDEHEPFGPPDINDFKRNARVLHLLGDGYRTLVKRLADDFEQALTSRSGEAAFISQTVAPFYRELEALVKSKTPTGEPGYMLTRNDPAGYAIALLDKIEFDFHLSIIRNPVDVAYEWCQFYHKTVDEPTIRKFANQFCKKIDRFTREFEALKPRSRERVALIAFEDIVSSAPVRASLCERLAIPVPSQAVRFDASKSVKNVGVGQGMNEDLKSFVTKVCGKKYDEFSRRYESLLVSP
ncbi:hypothetical protein OOT55_04575 [Marinimicrobium sp. C6131]|uniref:hypothetical protein n=1 Tax=Marinimicrobium sp. C6131 TaxID=3022676 RepID=UPI00223DE45E|nr:hypothetical protein [Marinimicrobium sp. C6131]UZJ45336.1 hypothetical protein OOT55_04575 [Marinimicrobium sp. C6131]